MPTNDPDLQTVLDQLAAIERKQDEILRRLEAVIGKPKPHLTRTEFAKVVGVCPNTVSRWIRAGRVLTQKGRVPYSEVRKFTS